MTAKASDRAQSAAEVNASLERVRAYLVTERKSIDGKQFDLAVQRWIAVCEAAWKIDALKNVPVPFPAVLNALHFEQIGIAEVHVADALWRGAPTTLPSPTAALEPGRLEVPKGYTPKPLVGENLVALKACTVGDLELALTLQAELLERTQVRLFLGTLLMALGKVTAPQFFHALAIQLGVPFTQFDLATVEKLRGAMLKRAKPRKP